MLITRQEIIDIFTAIKTAVEGAIPAGANAIGSVDVDNFPATVPEYMWFEGDAEPNPGAGVRAVGIYVSAADVWSVKHWDGAAWGDPA